MNDPKGMANDPIWRHVNMPGGRDSSCCMLPDENWREQLVQKVDFERKTQ